MALFDVLRTSSSMIICDPGDFSSNLVVVRGLMGCDWCGYIYSGGFTVGQKAASSSSLSSASSEAAPWMGRRKTEMKGSKVN